MVARGRAPRTDRVRAAAILFGGWILVDGLVLSYMQGMIHPYYSLSIAPAVAAMFAIGIGQMWARRESWWCRIGLAVMLLATGLWSWWTLEGNADWLPALKWAVLVLTVVASLSLIAVLAIRPRRGVVVALLGLAVAGALAGPAAYAVATVGAAHQGGGPSVGPARAGGRGMGMWGGRARRRHPGTGRDAGGDQHAVVGRHRPVVERSGARIVHEHRRHGDRWLLRHRSDADVEAVPGRRRPAPGRVLRRHRTTAATAPCGAAHGHSDIATLGGEHLQRGGRWAARRCTTCRRRNSLRRY